MRKEFKRNKKQKNNQASDKKEGHRLFLDEQYIRMAEEMERELFADGDSEIYESTDEEEARSYQILINRLKADGIYQEDDVEPDIGKKVVPLHRKIRLGKVAGVAILCCACIIAASMTSEANRNYFVKGIRYLAGDDTRVVVGNDDENEDINTDEYKAIEDIENQLGIDMPEFYYRPAGFEFLGYEVSDVVDVAQIEYFYKDNTILFFVDRQTENSASKITSMHGKEKKKIIKGETGVTISLKSVKDKQDDTVTYIAQWELDSVFFCLSGRMGEQEFIKILENIVF